MIKRSEKLAFMAITTVSGQTTTTTFKRMTGFTELSVSKNPNEYSRKYVDEDMERKSVAFYSPTISYKYDEETDNDVHALLSQIADNELTGESAKVTILIVNLAAPTAPNASSFEAVKRDYYVIPDSEGDDENMYTRNGSFSVASENVFGTATTEDAWQTAAFTAAE